MDLILPLYEYFCHSNRAVVFTTEVVSLAHDFNSILFILSTTFIEPLYTNNSVTWQTTDKDPALTERIVRGIEGNDSKKLKKYQKLRSPIMKIKRGDVTGSNRRITLREEVRKVSLRKEFINQGT